MAGPSAASATGAAYVSQLDTELEGTSIEALAILGRNSRDRPVIEAAALFVGSPIGTKV